LIVQQNELKNTAAAANTADMNKLSRLSHETINALVKKAEYAVRGEHHHCLPPDSQITLSSPPTGPIVVRAQELAGQLAKKDPNVPFKKIISCNIGV
jgi:hypothetical protein